MKQFLFLAMLIGLIFCACTTADTDLVSKTTVVPSLTFTPISLPSLTPSPTQTAMATITPQLTSTPTETSLPLPTDLPISDPLMVTLESEGYELSFLSSFDVKMSTDGTSFGGPSDVESSGHQLVVEDQEGNSFIYSQYVSPELGNCYLLFFKYSEGGGQLLKAYDVAKLNHRMEDLFDPTANPYFPPSVFCTTYGWGDVNQNGKPDMAISLMWANQVTGSELHVFEISDDTVVNLTENIDGILSPWTFDPTQTEQQVIAIDWAKHDCLYPPLAITWIYDWDEESYQYINVSADKFTEEYFTALKEKVTRWYGGYFYPFEALPPLVTLLVTRDSIGQREIGWQEFKELTAAENWSEVSEWLQSDIDHFTAEYNQGKPFTPNDFCEEDN